ncbi:ABC transporter substrate-binding protein [Bosea sp. (in: a-proteobacteria)]|uniref:ABC transporter substrate-binding protein n=1 Tax=Bosea sp. (in: a-proteobacteria) TaxID=1871050 RepID=UPI003B3A90A8
MPIQPLYRLAAASRAVSLALALVAAGTVAARADALSDAKARGKLLVGVEAGGTGAVLSQTPDGKIIGQDAELNAYIAKKLGLQLEMVPTAWPGIIPALLSGRFDMILSGMTATGARAERVNFSIPYGDASLVAATTARNTKLNSVADLPGRTIGVLLGTNTVDFARKYSAALTAAGKPGMTIKTYDDIPTMVTDMVNGNIDGLMLPHPIIGGYAAQQPGKFRIIEGLGDKSFFAVAVRKEDTSLLDAVNAALADARKDGTLAALQTKWLGAPVTDLPDVAIKP